MSEHYGDDAATYLGWFFLGALAGAAAALLLAPKSGRETREILAEQGGDLLTKAQERGGDFFKRAQEKAGEAQVKAGDMFEKGREYFEEQTQRLVSAFEAGKSAMKEEMNKGRPEG